MVSSKNILKKTILVGTSTLMSRFLGIIREVLMVHYLGASGLSDAFLTAFKIPNSLRKIFAEGALSAAFVPSVVKTLKHHDKNAIAGLMSLAFIFFEGIVLLICFFIMYYAGSVLQFIAPGFSPEQIQRAIPLLHILTPFIFFISSGALLAAPLNAIGHFFIPASAPIIMNIIFILGLCICLFFTLSVTSLCWFVLSSGSVHFLMHVITYLKFHFSFGTIKKSDFALFRTILGKFIVCLPSISLMEIALFIDTSFASLLAPGSISLIFYANRFLGIPLGVFAVAFSTILLPHFSRVQTYSPKRLHFYVLESAKFICWVTMPIALLMTFFASDIFATIFLSKNFTMTQVEEAGNILRTLLAGLFFFSFNKIILNIFYAIHAAWIPALISLIATIVNILLNMLFIEQLQSVGLAMATTLSGIFQTALFLVVLKRKYNFKIYVKQFMKFMLYYSIQLTCVSTLFYSVYKAIVWGITTYTSEKIYLFFLSNIGLWMWISPLALIALALLYYSRSLFNIQLHFLK